MNRCTQVLHRNAWTPLHNRGKIVDTIAPVGVLIAARARGSGDVGGELALLFGDACVDRAVELVLLQLALDVGL